VINRYITESLVGFKRGIHVDISDAPDTVPAPDEAVPDFADWEDPDAVVRDGPIRERLLDVIVQVREPTKVAVIAERADCDTGTAREYLQWFASMGIVREHAGRPVRYERNESYLFWRRVERIRREAAQDEIVTELSETVAAIEQYRERFDVDTPGAVPLVDASDEASVEAVWEAVSDWKTLERRAALLEAALQDGYSARGSIDSVDV